MERRTVDVTGLRIERAQDGKPHRLEGHAAVFDSETVIGNWFREVIRAGAFAQSIADKDDVRALWNHDANHVLGRTAAKTLRLKEDDTGLFFSADLPDTQTARDLAVSVDRGDVSQCSFGFELRSTDGQRWIAGEKGMLDLRELLDVKLWDVSPVTFPAYEDTDVGLREYRAWQADRAGADTPKPEADEADRHADAKQKRAHLVELETDAL